MANGQPKKFPGHRPKKTLYGQGRLAELTVPLPVKGQLLHLRLFLPLQKQPVKLDWIEIGPAEGKANETKRWDFKIAALNPPTKPPNLLTIEGENR